MINHSSFNCHNNRRKVGFRAAATDNTMKFPSRVRRARFFRREVLSRANRRRSSARSTSLRLCAKNRRGNARQGNVVLTLRLCESKRSYFYVFCLLAATTDNVTTSSCDYPRSYDSLVDNDPLFAIRRALFVTFDEILTIIGLDAISLQGVPESRVSIQFYSALHMIRWYNAENGYGNELVREHVTSFSGF